MLKITNCTHLYARSSHLSSVTKIQLSGSHIVWKLGSSADEQIPTSQKKTASPTPAWLHAFILMVII